MRGWFLSSIAKVNTLFQTPTAGAAVELSEPTVDDLAKFLTIDDEASSVPRYNLFAIEFIQIFGDLLTRGADDAGERLVTDGQSDQDSARVGCSKVIRQI